MIDQIKQYLLFLQQNPALLAGVVGVLFSWAATQTLKFMIPATVSDANFKVIVRLIGVITGWLFGFLAWNVLDPKDREVVDFFYALGVGFVSPALYSIVVPLAVSKWPALDKYISGRPGV